MTEVPHAQANEQTPSRAVPASRSVDTERGRLKEGTAGEETFSAVFESSGEALLVTDSVGVIHRANRRARYLLGLGESAVGEINLGNLLAKESGSEVLFLLDSAKVSKLSHIDATLAAGRPVAITARAMVGPSALLLSVEEGPAAHRRETKRWQVRPELKSVLDSVLTGIVVFDPAGRIRFLNASMGELLGIQPRSLRQVKTAEDLRGILVERLRNPENLSARWAAFAQGEGEPHLDELEIFRPERRVIERSSRPVLRGDGRNIGWIELYADVTSERHTKSKMLQTEKMAALGQLVSGIAHELNNPLTAIMGYAQLLLGQGLAPEQFSKARLVYDEAERACRIVKNLLYFARENKPSHSRVDVNEVIARTVALRSYELKVKNIAIHCDLAQTLPQTMADPYQLQQVILNLLINAEQALAEGCCCPHVWIRTRRVSRRGSRRIAVEIIDDGPGIPAEISDRVFEPFFTTKPPGVGTGLGLSIVYGIVQQHGGDVSFDSQVGRGTRFVVELPIVAAPTEMVSKSLFLPLAEFAHASRGRVLAVEDEPAVAQLIVDVLQEEGHRVEAVLDSKEGLARLARGSYDLVICDLRMPGLDGPAFYEALVRARSPMQNRILFVTGDMLSSRTREFLEPKRLPHLAKPFLVEELKLAVNRLLEQAAGGPRTGASRARAKANVNIK